MPRPPLDPPEPTPRPTRPPVTRPPRPPPPPQPPLPAGQVPSITSWTRLETRCRDPEMRRTIAARIHDPLWLLTRQWQVGEFQGEDAGSPVIARTRARTTALTRVHLGELPANTATEAAPYDSQRLPLETLVERRSVRADPAAEARQWRLAVDAGLHFLRLLELQPMSASYRAAFVRLYALALPEPDALPQDPDTLRFAATMAGRAIDGRRLAAAFRTADGRPPRLDPALGVASGDRAEVQRAAADWLAWYDHLFSEPADAAQDAWVPQRLEYAVSIAGRLSAAAADEKTLTAAELGEGQLDWCDFDLDLEVNLGTARDRAFRGIVQTTMPAPVSFRGAPAPRFWEFEDARVEYGLLPVGPADLAQLMMIEYTSSYGNDWFLVPLELPVGSLTTVDSLVVTDTFGVRTLLRPLGDRALGPANWSMFQQAWLRRAGSELQGIEPNLFFLAPAVGSSLQGGALEEVLFLRDEGANVAWAIERKIESGLGRPVDRGDAALQPQALPEGAAGTEPVQRYVLASQVPDHWIPLLPVQLPAPGGGIVSRLQRGAVLRPDGSRHAVHAGGVVLNLADPLLVQDEEVPREGLRVTRHYQMARWTDGACLLWMAHRTHVGKGEGSSGLRFDAAV